MIYYMDSRVFLREYLNLEKNWKILDTYYVVASMRISRSVESRNEMIQSASTLFYPSAAVMMQMDKKSMEITYRKQLNSATRFLATVIKGSIKKNYDIVFIATRKETKNIPYLKWLADFIMDTFEYPVYSYHKLLVGKEQIIDFDADTVLQKCKEYGKKSKDQAEEISTWSKKKLIKKLEEHEIYMSKECTKEELLEAYVEFVVDRNEFLGSLD